MTCKSAESNSRKNLSLPVRLAYNGVGQLLDRSGYGSAIDVVSQLGCAIDQVVFLDQFLGLHREIQDADVAAFL